MTAGPTFGQDVKIGVGCKIAGIDTPGQEVPRFGGDPGGNSGGMPHLVGMARHLDLQHLDDPVLLAHGHLNLGQDALQIRPRSAGKAAGTTCGSRSERKTPIARIPIEATERRLIAPMTILAFDGQRR